MGATARTTKLCVGYKREAERNTMRKEEIRGGFIDREFITWIWLRQS